MLDSLPDPLHDIAIVPDYAAAVAGISCQSLPSAADVDHCLFPLPVCAGFGGADEGVAFGFCEGVVYYYRVVFSVFWDGGFGEVDEVFGRCRDFACQESRGESVG